MKKVLNLYAGLGGNRKFYKGCEVTAVEIDPKIAKVYQGLYPNDTVIIGDAHEYLRVNYNQFDFITSSPPCPTHSAMAKFTRHKNKQFPNMMLYEEILFLRHFYKGFWTVENVVPFYEPLITPTFKIGRHFFWSNFDVPFFEEPKQPKNFINEATVKGSEMMKDWLGIHYEGNIYHKGNHCPSQVLRNCVHPLVGEHVYKSIPFSL